MTNAEEKLRWQLGAASKESFPAQVASDQKPEGTEEASRALAESFQAEGASKLAVQKEERTGHLVRTARRRGRLGEGAAPPRRGER